MNSAALYCRLSKEDYDKQGNTEESESIINQKLLLTEYAISHGYTISDIYIDEDYSGLYDDRPAFKRLIRDAKLRRFNIILAKTQSRFTRNMEHAEKYLHNDFPQIGIRFIGVVDGIDSAVKSNKKVRQISGLINEWYSEDLSENIKAVFLEKMKSGQYIGPYTCYGYEKDPMDHHKIIIDEEAAYIVRLIYRLYLEGHGIGLIAEKLTAMKLPTPTEYKHRKGHKFYNPNRLYSQTYGIWSTTTIKRILSNEAYIGTLIQGKERKVSYKSKKIIAVPKDEWIIIPHSHEAIISAEEYVLVQKILHQRRKRCFGTQYSPHIFAGIIKCADCGSTMVKTAGKSGDRHGYFICQLNRKTKGTKCTRHSVSYDGLKEMIENKIKSIMIEYFNNDKELIMKKLQTDNHKTSLNNLKLALSGLEAEITELNNSFTALYIDKVKGMISEDEFLELKMAISEKRNLLLAKAELLKEELRNLYNEDHTYFEDIILNRYIDFNELTFEIVRTFISCIYISEKKNGIQKIMIDWNY